MRKKTRKARSKMRSCNNELREIGHREKVKKKVKNRKNQMQKGK